LLTEAYRCEQLAQDCSVMQLRPGENRAHDLMFTKRLYLRRRKGTSRCYVYGCCSVARWR